MSIEQPMKPGLLCSELKNDLHSDQDLAVICSSFSVDLQIGPQINSLAFLKSLMGVESSFGKRNIARFEPAYAPGGLYFQRSKPLRDLYEIWGAPVSMSYGPFQIMYATAINLGYPTSDAPEELWSGFVSAPYVVKYLNAQFKNGADTIEKLASSYNGGSFSGPASQLTAQYVKKFIGIYQQLAPK